MNRAIPAVIATALLIVGVVLHKRVAEPGGTAPRDKTEAQGTPVDSLNPLPSNAREFKLSQTADIKASTRTNSSGRTPSPTDSAERTDRSTIGTAFPVSASIVAACNEPGLNAVHFCSGLYEDLTKLANEPRDLAWAANMEQKLQAYVERDFKDSPVRNIECRTSWCAIEVVSSDRQFSAVFHYPNPLNDQLQPQNWAVSTEKDASSANLHVLIVTYKRK
jgi:hypothetical protein